MKRFSILFLPLFLLLLTGCSSPDMQIPDGPRTAVKWKETTFDFGKVKEEDVVKHSFTFTNTGKTPLKIGMVKPSCSCTAKDYTKTEVAPGEDGYVELSFNPKGKEGLQQKSATVSMNSDPPIHTLEFTVEVVK